MNLRLEPALNPYRWTTDEVTSVLAVRFGSVLESHVTASYTNDVNRGHESAGNAAVLLPKFGPCSAVQRFDAA